MSAKMVHKVRKVRCPKCRVLLQEPQGYHVYKCGGCGTKLQGQKAKFFSILFYSLNFILLQNYA